MDPISKGTKEKATRNVWRRASPHTWTEQDIHEGARKIIKAYFEG